METTILLSKVLGLFIAIAGATMMLRKEYFVPVIGLFVKDRLTRIVLAFAELAAGLFLLVQHFDFSSLPAGIITVLGIMMTTESVMYVALPDRFLSKFISKLNNPGFYMLGGLLSSALGLYLAGYGFGLI